MAYRRGIGAAWFIAASCLLQALVVEPMAEARTTRTVFEHSVLKGGLDQNVRDYYAAIWTSLTFFHGTDSARALLAPLDVMTQRREVDSIINVLFLPLDSDPITPGNSFLQGLTEKIDYCRNRGFLHTGGASLDSVFDELGVLVLLNGIPDLAFKTDMPPVFCTYEREVPQYFINWWGEDFYFQEDCFGGWKLVGREFPRGGYGMPPKVLAVMTMIEQLKGGVAVFDPDEPLNEHSVMAQPIAILDTTDWRSEWTVVNLGLRARDFVRDSSGWKRLWMSGALSVGVSGADQTAVFDSVLVGFDWGREKPGRDDLVALQRIEKTDRLGGNQAIRGRVLGVDLVNPKDHHWKKSIPYPVGWSDDSVTVGYGWLLNPRAVNASCLGGRPPLINDVVTKGDTLLLFFQLTGVESDMEGRFRTHVRLRFVREEEHKHEVILSRLYRLGTEPLGNTKTADPLAVATLLGMVEMPSSNGNTVFAATVPTVHEGTYKLVAECHRTTGADPRPFAMVIFNNVRIKDREAQAVR